MGIQRIHKHDPRRETYADEMCDYIMGEDNKEHAYQVCKRIMALDVKYWDIECADGSRPPWVPGREEDWDYVKERMKEAMEWDLLRAYKRPESERGVLELCVSNALGEEGGSA